MALTIEKCDLNNIISCVAMCITDKHPDGILGTTEYCYNHILKICGNKDVAEHATTIVSQILESKSFEMF